MALLGVPVIPNVYPTPRLTLKPASARDCTFAHQCWQDTCKPLRTLATVQVTLRAELFGADTTSHGAAGLWEPYKLGARHFAPRRLACSLTHERSGFSQHC